jgi:Uma2 family endonuclease
MADVQVICIRKQPRPNPHEGITHLGNFAGTWTKQSVIGWIEERSSTFFVMTGDRRADIAVIEGPNGKYLRSYADNAWNDDLLLLPECV